MMSSDAVFRARSTPASSKHSRIAATQKLRPPAGTCSSPLDEASVRPSHHGSMFTAWSASSTLPPGNTYWLAANTAAAVRRIMNTSIPDAAASLTSMTVAAGRVGTRCGS
ncbi:unannotated protein [freshwater metagenome]|uniref:Unannotated protein n=1 Tax=freshwater metagenome TaxID=449393 RepID=A0A6J7EAQ7_9ZZZZ